MTEYTWDAKYADAVEKFYADWTSDIPEGDSLASVAAVATDGLVIDSKVQNGNVTRLTISGGKAGHMTARVQLLATMASGDKIGRNVTLPVLRR